jgi:LacI family transcriptional regulator
MFITHDAIAYGMMKRLTEAGLRIPEDLAMVGFGDLIPQRFITTDLTSLNQPGYEKGFKAGEMLVQRLEGKAGKKNRNVLLDPPLVVRKSCGCK